METKQTRENLSDTFLTDLSGIFKIANFKKSVFKTWTSCVPVFAAPLFVLVAIIFKLDIVALIIEIKNIMISFLPGILGFTIAGYSLMIGFIQSGILDKISEPMKDSKFSLYQKMSATFALNVMLQGLALFFAYLVHFINYIDANRHLDFSMPTSIESTTNYTGLVLIIFWFLISLFMVVQIVLNIFSFSQLHHYFINKFKIEEKEKVERENEEKTLKK